LGGERKEIVAPPGEIPLLVPAAVDERHVVQTKSPNCVLMAEVTEDAVRMLFRIAHDVGHAGLLPSCISLLMAGPATLGPHEMRSRGRWLLGAGTIGILQSFGTPLRKRAHGKNKLACNDAEHERPREFHQVLFSAGSSLNAISLRNRRLRNERIVDDLTWTLMFRAVHELHGKIDDHPQRTPGAVPIILRMCIDFTI
jgi:hypothetical protein